MILHYYLKVVPDQTLPLIHEFPQSQASRIILSNLTISVESIVLYLYLPNLTYYCARIQ